MVVIAKATYIPTEAIELLKEQLSVATEGIELSKEQLSTLSLLLSLLTKKSMEGKDLAERRLLELKKTNVQLSLLTDETIKEYDVDEKN